MPSAHALGPWAVAYILERWRSAARILEIISPSGFEQYFREMVALPQDATPADRAAIAARYALDVDPQSIPRLIAEYGLRFSR